MKVLAIIICIILALTMVTGAVSTLSSGFTNLEVSTWMDRFAASEEPVVTEDPLLNLEEEPAEEELVEEIFADNFPISSWVKYSSPDSFYISNSIDGLFSLYEIGSHYSINCVFEDYSFSLTGYIVENNNNNWFFVADNYQGPGFSTNLSFDLINKGYGIFLLGFSGCNDAESNNGIDFISLSVSGISGRYMDFPYENFSIVSIVKII